MRKNTILAFQKLEYNMRLKFITAAFFCLFFSTYSFAQCKIENGGFENWVDVEFFLPDGMGGEVSDSVTLPEFAVPAFRYALLSFSASFDPSLGVLWQDEAQEMLGVSQSTDASEGDFAVKLQGGYGSSFADVYGVHKCTEVPEQFNVDIKHVGNSQDTLGIIVIYSEGLAPLPQSSEDFDSIPSYIDTLLVFDSDSEYETFSFPVIKNFDAAIDTFYFDIGGFTSDSSYFLIDNVNQSDNTGGCDIPAPLLSLASSDTTCICNGQDIEFPLDYTEDAGFEYNELIVNEDGFILSIDNAERGIHSEVCSGSEGLSAQIIAYEDTVLNLNVNQNLSDLEGCFSLSNAVQLNTYSISEVAFNVFVDGEQQDDNISLCLLDDITETFTFSTDINQEDIAILLINEATQTVELRIDNIDSTETFSGFEPGNYLLTAVGYAENLNLNIGDNIEELTSERCFGLNQETYALDILGPDEGCVTSLNEQRKNSLSIYPNYSTGIFEIKNPENISYRYTIVDMQGKVVQLKNTSSPSGKIDLIGHQSGLYNVIFELEAGVFYQQRIMKL
jgi:hypothetical protein